MSAELEQVLQVRNLRELAAARRELIATVCRVLGLPRDGIRFPSYGLQLCRNGIAYCSYADEQRERVRRGGEWQLRITPSVKDNVRKALEKKGQSK